MATIKHDCDRIVASTKKGCKNAATIFRERDDGKHWCGVHGKAKKGEAELTKDSPVTEKGPYFLIKLAQPIAKSTKTVHHHEPETKPKVEKPAAVEKATKSKKVGTKKEEKEEVEVPAGACVEPSKKDHDAECPGKTGKGDICGKKAGFACAASCPHTHGVPMCKTHWNQKHKGTGSGKKRESKEIPADQMCKDAKKDGSACETRGFGVNTNGLWACWRHGGPKKGDVGGSDGGSSTKTVTQAPKGALSECPVLEVMFYILQFEEHHQVCDFCTPELVCGAKQSFEWLKELLAIFRPGSKDSSAEAVMAHLATIGTTKEGIDFVEAFETSVVEHLKEAMGQENIVWLTNLLDRMARQPGDLGSQVEEEWKKIAKEQGIKIVKAESSAQGSSEKKGSLLSSRSTNLTDLEKAMAKSREAKKKKDAEAAQASGKKSEKSEKEEESKPAEKPAEKVEEHTVEDEEEKIEEVDIDIE